MYKNKINTLLIGLGKIGCGYDLLENFEINNPKSSKKIISHARATTVHPKFNLVAAIDRNKKATYRFKSVYKIPTFDCIDNFLKNINCSIDLVIIAVIPQNQPNLVDEVINKLNPKVLLLEKPLAVSLNEAKRIKKICESRPNLTVFVNYIRRYLPLVEKWREIILSGEIGDFINGNIIYGKGLLSNGSHFINLAQYWLGKLQNHQTLKNELIYEGFDRETSLILKTDKNNALLNINSIGGYQLRAGELDLWFEKGRICWLNNGNSLYFWPRVSSRNSLENFDSLSVDPEVFFTEINKSQYYVLESISKHLYEDQKISSPCSLDDCMETMELIYKASFLDSKNYAKK